MKIATSYVPGERKRIWPKFVDENGKTVFLSPVGQKTEEEAVEYTMEFQDALAVRMFGSTPKEIRRALFTADAAAAAVPVNPAPIFSAWNIVLIAAAAAAIAFAAGRLL